MRSALPAPRKDEGFLTPVAVVVSREGRSRTADRRTGAGDGQALGATGGAKQGAGIGQLTGFSRPLLTSLNIDDSEQPTRLAVPVLADPVDR